MLKLFAFFLSLVWTHIGYAISLPEVIDYTKGNNRDIKLELVNLENTKTLKSEVISEFLPDVSASIEYGNEYSSYPGQITDESTKQKTESINVTQPIFNGFGSVARYREANYKIRSAYAKARDKIQEILFNAVASYCNLFRYTEIDKLQKSNKILGEELIRLAERRKTLRVIDSSEIIKFRYEVAEIEVKYVDAESKLMKAKFDYENIVGLLHRDISKPELQSLNISQSDLLSDIENNDNVISYYYNYLASKASYNSKKSDFLPSLVLSISSSKESNVVYLDNEDLRTESVLLNLSVPIFQKGSEYVGLKQARFSKNSALIEYEIIKEEVVKEVNQLFAEYEYLTKLYNANKNLFLLAKEREKILVQNLTSKMADSIEVVRAKIEANDKAINLIDSEMNLIIAGYKIKYFMGDI